VVTVTAGDRVSKDIIVGAGHLSVAASYSDGNPVADGSIYYDVFEAKKNIQGERKEISGGYGPAAAFDLLPGDYWLVTKLDATTVEQAFSIKAAEGLDIDVPLNAGILAISSLGDGDYLEVFGTKKDIQGNRKSFGGGYGPTISRTLPAGDYHLVLTLANSAGTKEADATVNAGERTETTIP
jgi:Ca-activated chloride channel family protein